MNQKYLPATLFLGIAFGLAIEDFSTLHAKNPTTISSLSNSTAPAPEPAKVQTCAHTQNETKEKTQEESPAEVEYFNKVITITAERRFRSLLCSFTQNQGLEAEKAFRKAGITNPRRGDKVCLSFKKEEKKIQLLELDYYHRNNYYTLSLQDGKTKVTKHAAKRTLKQTGGNINQSFYNSAVNTGTPTAIVAECVTGLKQCIDFRSQVKKGAKFNIVYDVVEMKNGHTFSPQLKYIELFVQGKRHCIYNFQGKTKGYFDEKGAILGNSCFKKPLLVSRIRATSNFGWRIHPVHGNRRFHAGIDYKAKRGTPVVPAAPGQVVFAGTMSGYGKIIEIAHTNGYTTRYAHLSRIHKRQGQYVNTGEIIGLVGATGTATAPHLHFEIRHHNKPLNPIRHISLPKQVLKGEQLRQFCSFKKQIHKFLDEEQKLMA